MRASLSVIMPNYNDARFLPRSLEAILSQSRQAMELIVVDDGSTDSSVSIIEQFASKHPNLRLLRNERNLGVVATVNRALDAATGDFVYGASANDYVLPLFFERALEMADRYPMAGIVFGKFSRLDPVGNEIVTRGMSQFLEPTFVGPEAFLRDCMGAKGRLLSPATMYRRDCLEEVGRWREELGYTADTFSAAAIGLKHGAAYVPKRLACYSVRPNGLGHTSSANPKHRLDIIARTVYLMRSDHFRSRFPESYVSQWENWHRHKVVKNVLRARALSVREAVLPADRFRLLGRAVERIVKHLPSAEARRLRDYPGDISCYEPSEPVRPERHA